jgi:hypothetical protein
MEDFQKELERLLLDSGPIYYNEKGLKIVEDAVRATWDRLTEEVRKDLKQRADQFVLQALEDDYVPSWCKDI